MFPKPGPLILSIATWRAEPKLFFMKLLWCMILSFWLPLKTMAKPVFSIKVFLAMWLSVESLIRVPMGLLVIVCGVL